VKVTEKNMTRPMMINEDQKHMDEEEVMNDKDSLRKAIELNMGKERAGGWFTCQTCTTV
jgi:hypothetical protein